MKKILLVALSLVPFVVFGLTTELSTHHYVSDVEFIDGKIGVFIGTGSWNTELGYEVDRSNLSTKAINPTDLKKKYPNINLTHRDFLPDYNKSAFTVEGKSISYEYIGCNVFKEIEAAPGLSKCKQLKLKIDNDSFTITSDYYFYYKLADPVFFENFLIFKVVVRAGITDRGKKYPQSVNGIVAFDLKEKKEYKNLNIRETNTYSGTFVSLIKKDIVNKTLWIGTNYGLYGLNDKLEEKISCFYHEEKNDFQLKCTEADFLDDYKWDQAMFLNKKLTGGKVVDNTKYLNLKMKCLEKIDRKLLDKFYSDPDPKKWEKAEYEPAIKCSRDNSNLNK